MLVAWGRSDYTKVKEPEDANLNTDTPAHAPVSVIVPARNEAATIARVVTTMADLPHVDEVLVVDNGSDDDTARRAQAAGARVVEEPRPGMGHAIRAGYLAARTAWVMKVDADLDRFDTSRFGRMIEARAPGIGLVKGQWQDPRDPMPMTRYLVQPALRLMFPALGALNAPNSGLYVFDRSLIATAEIVGDYAADLDVMLRVHAAGASVTEVDIGRLDNNPRDPGHYAAMSDTIMGFLMSRRDLRLTEEIAVLADGVSSVVRRCLGTVAGHARAGGRATIFLPTAKGTGVDAITDALADFPTVRIKPLDEAAGFAPAPAAQGLRIIAPAAALRADHPLNDVVSHLRESHAALEAQVHLMPEGDGARIDVVQEIDAGQEIKRAVLARLSLPASGADDVETFRRWR